MLLLFQTYRLLTQDIDKTSKDSTKLPTNNTLQYVKSYSANIVQRMAPTERALNFNDPIS